ncbi:MAG: hypothetical protein KAU94_03915 [Verrucomicrobia bacterium]|nr:hypothetical protein [Verrucomicrobiota bacterium]
MKKRFEILMVVLGTLLLAGCVTSDLKTEQGKYSKGYYPIDPIPIQMAASAAFSNQIDNALILTALPDESMRLAVGSYNVSGGITYGPAGASYSKGEYVVILDYTKCTTVPVYALANANNEVTILSDKSAAVVPVYAGVGLRLKAHISIEKGSVNLGSLFALGAAVEANKASGSLVVQTLGISGESISNLLPMPSEISISSIQSCIVALGSIKAKMHEADTQITPRLIGFSTSIGMNEALTTSFINQLMNHNARLYLGQEIEFVDRIESEDDTWDDVE